MFANNENGIVQPIANTAKIIRQLGGILHVDAVQALARIPFDINEIEADLLTISAHKIGGPKGVGALIKREESLHLAAPLMKGGGQERGQRAGTENVAAIAGFGAAAVVARGEMNDDIDRMRCLRDALEAGLKAIRPETMVFGAGVDRLPNTTLFSMSGMKAETAVIALDLEGVAVSSGAACSSGKVQASHVLAAMGVSPSIAQGAVRVSLGPTTTQTDVDCFLEAWRKLSGSLFKESHGVAA